MRGDVAALAGIVRDSAGAGEREAARLVARRLVQAGARDVRVVPFRGQRTYAWAHLLPAAAGLTATGVRHGGRRAAVAAAALALLELDASGRAQPLRRMLPAGEGATVLARVPAAGAACRTLVLVAHHDAAHTGVAWHPALARGDRARRLRTQSMGAFMAPTAVGLALAALPWRAARRAARVLLGASVLADLDIARSPTVPGASDNATGVAALIALAERFAVGPLPGTDVVLASVGCEESGMEGMRAALRELELDPATTLVLGLDTLGAGTPIVASAEGTLLAHRYRADVLALADAGAARAGVAAPQRWRLGGWTDPVLAVFAGIPALSLLSIGPDGGFTDYHLPTDLPERVDWASVEQCVALAFGIAETFARI